MVLERQSRAYVLGRVRAGVLEWGTVETLRENGLGDRLDREGHEHDGFNIAWRGKEMLSIELRDLVGKPVMAYGQTKIQEDLYTAAAATGIEIVFEALGVELHDVASAAPFVTFTHNGTEERIDCDFIAGCDGFHGVSRESVPAKCCQQQTTEYPFGWLGILAETPPLPTLLYANHARGFALCSERNPMLSRFYVQCPLDDTVDDWPDDRFYTELFARIPSAQADLIDPQPSVEKSIAPVRSFVCEPMRYGNMLLAGDAAHIVPPTGAKGLNVAVSDVRYLSRALIAHYRGDPSQLDLYSEIALRRVTAAMQFSWWFTRLLHRFPDHTREDQRSQEEELAQLAESREARTALAEQYVGLPYED